MSAWDSETLARIAAAEELEIAPVRRDGDLRRATPIWVVRVGDELYIRSATPEGAGWYGVARTSRQAHVRADGVDADVAVLDADASTLDAVDAAYRTKYGAHYAGIVDRITDEAHRPNTLRLQPRS